MQNNNSTSFYVTMILFCIAKFIVPDSGNNVDSGIRSSNQPASLCSLASRYDSPLPELTLSPQTGTKNLTAVFDFFISSCKFTSVISFIQLS